MAGGVAAGFARVCGGVDGNGLDGIGRAGIGAGPGGFNVGVGGAAVAMRASPPIGPMTAVNIAADKRETFDTANLLEGLWYVQRR